MIEDSRSRRDSERDVSAWVAVIVMSLVVLVTLIGQLVAVLWPTAFVSREEQARVQLSALGNAIDMYKLNHEGVVPMELSELSRADERSGESYIAGVSLDPWGSSYDYERLSQHEYRITCLGADGVLDTDDDLIWPEPRD